MAIEVRGMAPLLQVFDMPLSIAFYRDVLGFEEALTAPWAESTASGTPSSARFTAFEYATTPPTR